MLNEKGFLRSTYDELLEKNCQRAKELFGQDVDTSELTALGKFIRIAVYDIAEAYEDLEGVYYSRFPNTARGVALDRLCPFVGITRYPPTSAAHEVEFTGDAGSAVPIGFIVGAKEGVNFHTLYDTVLDQSGKGIAIVECEEFGTIGNVYLGAINEIVNPSAEIESVSHIGIIEKGQKAESDYELRLRFTRSAASMGSSNAEAIKAEIMRIYGVESVTVVENKTDYEDSKGRPPHSFECYIYGAWGKDEDIARAIYNKKPIGIRSIGDIELQVLDKGGCPHSIRFSRTQEIEIRIKVVVSVDAKFSQSGIETIKDNLIAYSENKGNGDSLVHSALYGLVHAVTGVVEVAELLISAGSDFTNENVVCNVWQAVSLKRDAIEIGVATNG